MKSLFYNKSEEYCTSRDVFVSELSKQFCSALLKYTCFTHLLMFLRCKNAASAIYTETFIRNINLGPSE